MGTPHKNIRVVGQTYEFDKKDLQHLHKSASHIIGQRISSSNISDASAAGYGLAAVSLLIMSKRYCGAGAVEGQEKRGRKQKCDAEGIIAARMGTYISNCGLLPLADAGGRLMYAYKDLQELLG
jgi:hypothetical protein